VPVAIGPWVSRSARPVESNMTKSRRGLVTSCSEHLSYGPDFKVFEMEAM